MGMSATRSSRIRLLAGGLVLLALPFAGWVGLGGLQPRIDPLPSSERADLVRIEKAARRLSLYRQDRLLRQFPVALGFNAAGPKVREGDGRTPEGRYRLDYRNPRSGYHLSMHVSYPDSQDSLRAREGGCDPGGAIMIHGLRNGLGWMGRIHRIRDWTRGCVALTNPEMDDLWLRVPDGTVVEIYP